MSNETISIAGIDKAELLAALYNNSRPMGMGVFRAVAGPMTVEQARAALGTGGDHGRDYGANSSGNSPMYFDYLHGRPLKSDLSSDEFRPWGYDRDNGGTGTAAKIIAKLRASLTNERVTV